MCIEGVIGCVLLTRKRVTLHHSCDVDTCLLGRCQLVVVIDTITFSAHGSRVGFYCVVIGTSAGSFPDRGQSSVESHSCECVRSSSKVSKCLCALGKF